MGLFDVCNFLGKPYFQSPNCLIYHGDCLNFMKQLPNSVINLTVTSPPYNIGKEYETQMSVDEYLNWCQQWIAQVYRITASDKAFWFNLGYLSIKDREDSDTYSLFVVG